MTPSHRRTLALLLLVLAGPAQAGAEPLGRIFFTPERRAALDRQRQAALRPGMSRPTETSQGVIDGVVLRSSGRHTTWVDGHPVSGDGSLTARPAGAFPIAPEGATAR